MGRDFGGEVYTISMFGINKSICIIYKAFFNKYITGHHDAYLARVGCQVFQAQN